jgi:peptidylprolyl isomerase
MKQLYIIGIIIAIVLLVLTGLSKLYNGPKKDAAPASAITATEESAANTPAATTEAAVPASELTTTTSTTTTMETTKETTTVTLKTNKGDITLELYTKDMPVTTGNFLKLAESKFYDGVKFHRVIDGFMIQGGDPLTKDDSMSARWGSGGPGYMIPDEFGPRYSNVIGTIAMANAGPNTGGSQFFINVANNTYLDGKHPVFGKVTAGMDVVEAIAKAATGENNRPVSPIVINSVSVAK